MWKPESIGDWVHNMIVYRAQDVGIVWNVFLIVCRVRCRVLHCPFQVLTYVKNVQTDLLDLHPWEESLVPNIASFGHEARNSLTNVRVGRDHYVATMS